jgi:hypothetical protein
LKTPKESKISLNLYQESAHKKSGFLEAYTRKVSRGYGGRTANFTDFKEKLNTAENNHIEMNDRHTPTNLKPTRYESVHDESQDETVEDFGVRSKPDLNKYNRYKNQKPPSKTERMHNSNAHRYR